MAGTALGARERGICHRPRKAACIRKTEGRQERRLGPMKFFGIVNIQFVTMNIQSSRDLQIGPWS